MSCAACGHLNPAEARFCLKCGARIELSCAACGARLPRDAAFCMSCGQRVTAASAAAPATLESRFQGIVRNLPSSVVNRIMAPADGENRLVTVLFTDMSRSVASTAGMDPEEAAELVNGLLRAMVDVFSRYEGRIDRFLGDGALAVFGTPVAHEDDPERAVLSAMEIRTRAQGLGLNVTSGINTGQVYFGLMGPDEHHELTVMGPVVNLAARLQSKASPGEIIVGASTWHHVRGSFEFTGLSLAVKGIEEPVAAWRVDGRHDRLEKTRGLEGLRAALVGRDEEIAKLTSACHAALGGHGGTVSVIGEAGLGKSRLIAELKARACAGPPADAPLWLEGRCIELGGSTAYWPFIDMLVHFLAGTGQPGREGRAAAVRSILASLQERGDLAAGRVEEMGSLLGRLLGIRFDTAWDLGLEHAKPEQVKHQTFLALRDLLAALARARGAVVVLEDLHWADPLSVDLIALLMELPATTPLLLVCAYRPERDQRCWQLSTIASRKCPDRYTEILLRELSPAHSRELVQSLLSVDALPAPMRETILAQSQGNPFFVEEVIRTLIDTGAVFRDGERWSAREDVASTKVPESLQNVILGRVDRLEPELKSLLECASVIGRTFRRRILEQAQAEPRSLEEALARLEERALIYAETTVPEVEYSFKHVLTQQAVYTGILRRRRARLHAKTAEAIESLYAGSLDDHAEPLAFHWDQAGNVGRALGWLVKAGRRARASFLNDAALGYLRRALELRDDSGSAPGEERLQALVEIGALQEDVGRHAEAESAFREAADFARRLGRPPRERARICYHLVKTISARHRPEEYVPLGTEALAALGDDTECTEAALLEMLMAHAAFERGDVRPQCELAVRRRDLIRSSPYSSEAMDNWAMFALVNFLDKNDAAAVDWLDWVEAEARRNNDLVCLAAAHVRRGRDMLAPRGEWTRALQSLDEALGIYRRIGGRYLEARCHLYAGDVFYRCGRLAEAGERLRGAEALGAELEGNAHLQAEIGMLRGQLALAEGRPGDALPEFEAALGRAPGEQWEWFLRMLIGCTHLERGERRDAARAFTCVLGATLAFRLPPAYSIRLDLAHVLSLLENAADSEGEFLATCDLVRRKRPESQQVLSQWRLAPAEPARTPRGTTPEGLRTPPGPGWEWHDTFGDCRACTADGLEISAAPGRGLWGYNLGAPRLTRAVSGDFAVEVSIGPAADDVPSVGGIVLWKSERDFLRVDAGSLAPLTVGFGGCIGNSDIMIGRGRLAASLPRLRLERSDGVVRALCSAEGERWYVAGATAFPVEDPVEVGLFVDGAIRPELYPRTCAAGSQVRFTGLSPY